MRRRSLREGGLQLNNLNALSPRKLIFSGAYFHKCIYSLLYAEWRERASIKLSSKNAVRFFDLYSLIYERGREVSR